MNLLCDENIKHSVYNLLVQEGYDVARVQDAPGLVFDDEAVIDHCRSADLILLTNDDDFFDFDDHPGILFLTDQTVSPRSVVRAIQRIDELLDPAVLANTVVHVPGDWV